MRCAVLALVCVSSVASAQVSIDVPARLGAWEKSSAKVVVKNPSGKPIVPLSIVLASDSGTISTWGVDGTEVRWGVSTPARRTKTGWEVLLGGPPPQQMMTPPDGLSQQATEQIIQLDPFAAGATVELHAPLTAIYQHGGKLTATMTYAIVDPKSLPLCTAAMPAQKAFVACKPVNQLGGVLYASHADLVKVQQTVKITATFTIDHPAFDVAAARAKAKVATGGYAYERATQKWILVDGKRTVTVGAAGAPEELPGDWLRQLTSLDGQASTSTYWNATPADAKQVAQRLGADKLSFVPFGFKGRTSQDRFVVTFERRQIPALAAAISALGYRMTESGIGR